MPGGFPQWKKVDSAPHHHGFHFAQQFPQFASGGMESAQLHQQLGGFLRVSQPEMSHRQERGVNLRPTLAEILAMLQRGKGFLELAHAVVRGPQGHSAGECPRCCSCPDPRWARPAVSVPLSTVTIVSAGLAACAEDLEDLDGALWRAVDLVLPTVVEPSVEAVEDVLPEEPPPEKSTTAATTATATTAARISRVLLRGERCEATPGRRSAEDLERAGCAGAAAGPSIFDGV